MEEGLSEIRETVAIASHDWDGILTPYGRIEDPGTVGWCVSLGGDFIVHKAGSCLVHTYKHPPSEVTLSCLHRTLALN